MISIVLNLLVIILFVGIIYIIRRLNSYIVKLETKVTENITLVENLQQSLKEVIAEGYLQNDGRLRKFAYQKETRNIIFNGRSEEETVEL